MGEYASKDFVSALFRDQEGFVEFRPINPKGNKKQIWIPASDVVAKWDEISPKLEKINKDGYNIYFGVNPRLKKDGSASSIQKTQWLFADIDYKGEAVRKNCSVLRQMSLMPTILISTGNGYHLYWKLKEPVDPKEAQKIMKNILIPALGADKTVHDPPRILRLPGTLNVKDPTLVSRCAIVSMDLGLEYSLHDFDDLEHVKAEMTERKEARKADKAIAEPSQLRYNLHSNGHGFAHAAARELARFWKSGVRHKMAMAVAGLLRRDDINQGTALAVVERITEITKDPERDDRVAAVLTTYKSDNPAAASLVTETLGEEEAKKFFHIYDAVMKEVPPPAPARLTMPDFNFYDCVPVNSLFDKYVQLQALTTDAPIQHHLASILTVSAAVLGNRAYLDFFNEEQLYPTLFTMIIAPPGEYRKSSTINAAIRIGRAVEGFIEYSDSATEEGLYDEFVPSSKEYETGAVKTISTRDGKTKEEPCEWVNSPSGIIKFSELGRLYGTSQKSYMQGIQGFFCELYDAHQTQRKTKSGGKKIVQAPTVSILGAIQPNILQRYLQANFLEMGLLSRNFIVPEPKEHNPAYKFKKKEVDKTTVIERVSEITSAMQKLSHCTGEIQVTDEAEDLWDRFSRSLDEKKKQLKADHLDSIINMICRLNLTVLKIAMIYACDKKNPVGMMVTDEEMTHAINFGHYLFKAIEYRFQRWEPTDKFNKEVQWRDKVLRAIERWDEKNPGQWIPRSILQRRIRGIVLSQMDEGLNELLKTGEIEKTGKRSRKYRLRTSQET